MREEQARGVVTWRRKVQTESLMRLASRVCPQDIINSVEIWIFWNFRWGHSKMGEEKKKKKKKKKMIRH